MVLLDTIPAIPAVNRWNKVFAPLVWFLFAVCFFGLVVEAFVIAHDKAKDDITDMSAFVSQQMGMNTEVAWW